MKQPCAIFSSALAFNLHLLGNSKLCFDQKPPALCLEDSWNRNPRGMILIRESPDTFE